MESWPDTVDSEEGSADEAMLVVEELITATLEGEELSTGLLSAFAVLLVPRDDGDVAAKRPVL